MVLPITEPFWATLLESVYWANTRLTKKSTLLVIWLNNSLTIRAKPLMLRVVLIWSLSNGAKYLTMMGSLFLWKMSLVISLVWSKRRSVWKRISLNWLKLIKVKELLNSIGPLLYQLASMLSTRVFTEVQLQVFQEPMVLNFPGKLFYCTISGWFFFFTLHDNKYLFYVQCNHSESMCGAVGLLTNLENDEE